MQHFAKNTKKKHKKKQTHKNKIKTVEIFLYRFLYSLKFFIHNNVGDENERQKRKVSTL